MRGPCQTPCATPAWGAWSLPTTSHPSQEMKKDIDKLGYKEIILKSDGEPALKSVQEEVKRRRNDPTILENSAPGDSRANGAAERAVQALGEHVRVLRAGLQGRLDMVIRGSHPVMTWLVQHAADCISKYQVGEDGKTGYERLKGKPFSRPSVEFGEKVHFKKSAKGQKEHKLDMKWNEGHFLGFHWRTSEAIVGTKEGIRRAGTIRRVGAHRRWDATGLDSIRGVPWKWDPEADDVVDKLLVRHLTYEEKQNMIDPVVDTGPQTVYRMRLKREDFIEKGYTEGCLGCRSILSSGPVRGHSEACRRRMQELFKNSSQGQGRLKRQIDREHEYYSRVLQAEEQAQKKQKLHTSGSPEGVDVERSSTKRSQEQPEEGEKRSRKMSIAAGASAETEPRAANGNTTEDTVMDSAMEHVDTDLNTDMETNLMERMFQDDMKWTVLKTCVRKKITNCVAQWPTFRITMTTLGRSWTQNRFKRVSAKNTRDSVKWVSMTMLAATPPLTTSMGSLSKSSGFEPRKGALSDAALWRKNLGTESGLMSSSRERRLWVQSVWPWFTHYKIMIMHVKCAFLYGEMRRNVYIELPHTDSRFGDAV